jgi:uncharacterized C2H2 Zn-finger protein
MNWAGWFGDPTVPLLGFEPRAGSADPAKIEVALSKRPKGFHDSTRAMVEENNPVERLFDPEGRAYLGVRCSRCGEFGAAGEMHLGHVTKWEAYARSFQPLCTGAVWALFNDARNLGFEHQVCNVSHLFEELPTSLLDILQRDGVAGLSTTDMQRLQKALKSSTAFQGSVREFLDLLPRAADIFQQLAQRHVPEQLLDVAGEFVLVNDDVEQVFVIPDVHRMPRQKVVLLKDYERPKWDDSTYHALYSIWRANGWVTKRDGVEFLRCGACHCAGEGHSMQIGHIVQWQLYLEDRGIARTDDWDGQVYVDTRAAFFGYSDLLNLRYEHQSCNVSHDWESESEGLQDDEPAFPGESWSDFIDVDEAQIVSDQVSQERIASEYRITADATIAILNTQNACDKAADWLDGVKAKLAAGNFPGAETVIEWLEEKVMRLQAMVDAGIVRRAEMSECISQGDADGARARCDEILQAERDGKGLCMDVEGFHERLRGGVVTRRERVRENKKLLSMTQLDFLQFLGPSTSLDDIRKVVERAEKEEEMMGVLRGV